MFFECLRREETRSSATVWVRWTKRSATVCPKLLPSSSAFAPNHAPYRRARLCFSLNFCRAPQSNGPKTFAELLRELFRPCAEPKSSVKCAATKKPGHGKSLQFSFGFRCVCRAKGPGARLLLTVVFGFRCVCRGKVPGARRQLTVFVGFRCVCRGKGPGARQKLTVVFRFRCVCRGTGPGVCGCKGPGARL